MDFSKSSVISAISGRKKLVAIIMSAEIISRASNLTRSTITLVVPKITWTSIVKNIAPSHKYITENLYGLATNPPPNSAPNKRIIGSVPIAIKPPKKEPMKAMLAT